jgi:Carboxypeptidase regulatory-like domain
MVKRGLSPFLVVLVVGLVFSTGLYASLDRGSIQGVVSDQQGAVIPEATVTITNVETNVAVTLKTNSAGFYLAPQLVPGKYTVRVAANGFKAYDLSNVLVTAGVTTTADAPMSLGTTVQTVQVTAAPPLVERSPSNYTTSLSTNYIQSIPLQGRDIQSLVQMIPGVTQSTGPSGSIFGFNSQYGGFPDPLHLVGSEISLNGSQGGANAWFLDGSLNAALGPEAAVVNPSPDAVAEFNVVNNGLSAEWGRTSGGVINVVLKSGTNQMHGDLYGYNRNSYFSATNPFARRDAQGKPFLQPRVNYNDIGGTVGGPVYLPHLYNGRDKTFFFASYDVSFLHENKPTILTVPLAGEKNGDFTGDPRLAPVCDPANGVTNCLYDPNSTTGPDANGLFHRTPFTTPVIPSSMIDPLAAFYVSSYPDPNFVDPLQQGSSGCGIFCNNYLGTVGSSQTTHNVSIKVDHTINPKNHLFAEWLYNPSYYTNYRYPWNGPTAQTTTGIAGAQPYSTLNQIFAVGLTTTLSPTLVNEARGEFSRQVQIAGLNSDETTGSSQIAEKVQGLNFFPNQFRPSPRISVGGLGSFGPQPWQNALQGEQAWTFTDNLTKLLGKHTIKTGLMFRADNAFVEWDWPFSISFSSSLTRDPVTRQGGNGLATFLTGSVSSASTGITTWPYQTNKYWGFYAQDEYRLTKNFTLNFGLRYDIFGWFSERHDNLANVDFNAMNPDVPSYKGALVYFGTSGHPARNVYPAHKTDFGPRIGFAWQPFGGGKTVVRASYGLIYSNGINASFASGMGAESSPAYGQGIGYNGDFTGQRPIFQFSQGAPVASLPDLSQLKTNNEQFLGQGLGFFLQGSKDPYVQQWSLTIQRQLPAGLVVNAGYIGTRGLHLITDEFRNYDYVPTAVRQSLRDNINLPVPTDPALGAIYGCGTSCPGYLVDLPYPQYTGLGANAAADGFNSYNAFQLRVEKRYSSGLNFLATYTYQKNIASANLTSLVLGFATPTTVGRSVGRSSQVPGGSGGPAGPLAPAEDPDNRDRYTALAPDDIPQILNLAVTYDLPFGKGQHFQSSNGVLNKVVGGWRLIQNWNAQSGVPLVFSAPCNAMSCLPNLVGNLSAGRSSKSRQQQEDQWFNPDAFTAPFGGDPATIQAISTGFYSDGSSVDFNTLNSWWTFGTSGERPPSGRSPGFWDADFTLEKNFHITESKYFQFRWEVLNALNHQSLGLPDTNWCLPPNSDGSVDAVHQFGCQFGKITNIQIDPRAMEFSLKFLF